jgi:hypothetical protein
MLMLYNFSDIIVSKLNLPVILLVLLSHCTFANAICKHSLLRGIYVILGRSRVLSSQKVLLRSVKYT